VLSRTVARLVLVFRKEGAEWKIAHSSISLPDGIARKGEVYPLNELADRNQYLEKLTEAQSKQLFSAKDSLQHSTEELAREISAREFSRRELQELLTNRTRELREAADFALKISAAETERIGQ
jgi:phosphoketolase